MSGDRWRWLEVEMSWVELGGGGLSWREVGARFSNTRSEKGIFKNFAIYTGKYLRRSLFLIKLQVFRL